MQLEPTRDSSLEKIVKGRGTLVELKGAVEVFNKGRRVPAKRPKMGVRRLKRGETPKGNLPKIKLDINAGGSGVGNSTHSGNKIRIEGCNFKVDT